VEKKLKIKLVKSLIGESKKIRANIKTLGLGKLNSSVEHKSSPDVLGKIEKAKKFLMVEEVTI